MSEPLILCYVCRHGETASNVQKIFRGSTDPGLNVTGFKQANELAFFFSEIDLGFIVASNKLRSRQTAETVHRGHDCTYQVTDGLRPWDIGDFGGQSKTKENQAALEYFVQNPDTPPPNGESLTEFRDRIQPRLRKAVELAYESPYPGMLVVHSSVLHEVGETFGNHHEDAHVKPGGVAAVFINEGELGCAVIFRGDFRSTTQNVLGAKRLNTIT
jgi:broad specificity phosphatase PhoE